MEEIDLAEIFDEIIHDMRGSLLSIKSGLIGVNNFLPKLLEAYTLACEHQLVADIIPQKYRDLIVNALQRANDEANILDMQISTALQQIKAYTNQLTLTYSMLKIRSYIDNFLQSYPCRSNDKDKLLSISITGEDFSVKVDAEVFKYMLRIFVCQSLYRIRHAGNGDMMIKLEKNGEYNSLIFQDSAKTPLLNRVTDRLARHYVTDMMTKMSYKIEYQYDELLGQVIKIDFSNPQ